MKLWIKCFLIVSLTCANTKASDYYAVRKANSEVEISQNPVIHEKSQCDCEENCIPCNNEPNVMCYFTNWAWYRPDSGKFLPSDINASLCTHVIYGFATLNNETYTIESYDPFTDITNDFYGLVTSLKEFGVKVILALGGWNDSEGDKYSLLVNNETLRKNFIKQSIVFLLKHNFTGLELNWEYPRCWQGDCTAGPESDVVNFGIFVKELSLAYRHVELTLSAAVAAGKNLTDSCYDIPVLSCFLDWINVIQYDFYSAKDGLVLPNAPFYFDQNDSVVFSLRHWEANGARKCKLNVGIAAYGHTFTLTDANDHFFSAFISGPGVAGNITRIEGVLSYQEICSLIKNAGWTVKNSWANGAIAYKDDQIASFTNILDTQIRVGLVKMESYGGVFLYALDYDDFNNFCGCGAYPLLTTINKEIRGLKTSEVVCY